MLESQTLLLTKQLWDHMKKYKNFKILDVKVDSNGKILIPSYIRKELNIKNGDLLTISLVEGNSIKIKKLTTVFKDMQTLFSCGNKNIGEKNNNEVK